MEGETRAKFYGRSCCLPIGNASTLRHRANKQKGSEMGTIKTAYIQATKKRGREGEATAKLLRRGNTSGVNVQVVFDPASSPWTCYKAILQESAKADGDADFCLLVHDDVGFASSFLESVKTILASAPDAIVSFYCATNKGGRLAQKSGKHIYETRYNWWPQCHAFPRSKIDDCLEFVHEHFPDSYYCEDRRLMKWAIHRPDQRAYQVVPSLTQHLGAYRSTVGIGGKVGSTIRNSFNFDPSFNVSTVDWEKEFADPFTTADPCGFVAFEGYRRSVHGRDLSLWRPKSGALK